MKKVRIKFLSIPLVLSIPIFSIFGLSNDFKKNNPSETNLVRNKANEKITNPDTIGGVFPQRYQSVYKNRYSQPVISSDPNNPGFMGVDDPNSFKNNFHDTIIWTGNTLEFSWARAIQAHPDLVRDRRITTPIILGAIHSDVGKTNNFRNQIIILVGDASNLNARNYALIRYNTNNGGAIDNGTTIFFNSPNAKLPTSADNSTLTMTYDINNDRYIVFPPGKLQDVKQHILSFSISNGNILVAQSNSTAFPGISTTWNSYPLSNENYLLGIESVPVTSFGRTNNVAIIWSPNPTSHFIAVELDRNFVKTTSKPENTNTNRDYVARSTRSNVIGLTNDTGVFSPNFNNFFDYIIPKISITRISDTYDVSMVIQVKVNELSEISFNRISFIRSSDGLAGVNVLNTQLNYGGLTNVRIHNIILSPKINPFVWLNPNRRSEFIITNQLNDNESNYASTKFVFDSSSMSTSNYSYNNIRINNESLSNSYINFYNVNPVVIEVNQVNNDSKFYYYSSFSKTTVYTSVESNSFPVLYAQSLNGGISHQYPLSSALSMGILLPNPNAKFPSQITNNELIHTGRFPTTGPSSVNHLISLFPSNIITPWVGTPRYDTSYGQIIRNDTNGTISGVIKKTITYTINGKTYPFISNIPFYVFQLRSQPAATNLLVRNFNLIENKIASQIHTSEYPQMFNLVNLPPNTTINWSTINPNNRLGTATIRATVNRWIDNAGITQNSTRQFELNVDTFKKISGTTIQRNDASISNLTVWDVNANSIGTYLDIENTFDTSGMRVSYSISNQNPGQGTLTVTAKIWGYGFFNPNNNGLPIAAPGLSEENAINLTLNVSGFRKITNANTTVTALPGNPNLPPQLFVTRPELLLDYVRVNNPVPNSSYTFSNVVANQTAGTLTANLYISSVYNNDGTINRDGLIFNLSFQGFNTTFTSLETTIIFIPNKTEAVKFFPFQVNSDNVSKWISILNVPSDATVTYSFSNDNNVSTTQNNGSVNVAITLSKWKNSLGNDVNTPRTFNATIIGLRSVSSSTRIIQANESFNLYPQNVSPQNLSQYISIQNGSNVQSFTTEVIIDQNSFRYDNQLGTINFQYRIKNNFLSDGRFNANETINSIQITNFRIINSPTTIIRNENYNISNITAENITESQIRNNYQFINTITNPNTDVSNATFRKVSFNNQTGTVVVEISNVRNFVNENYEIVSHSGVIRTELSGFRIVSIASQNIELIIGIVSGVILFILLAILIIVIIKRRRDEDVDLLISENVKTTPTKYNPPIIQNSPKIPIPLLPVNVKSFSRIPVSTKPIPRLPINNVKPTSKLPNNIGIQKTPYIPKKPNNKIIKN